MCESISPGHAAPRSRMISALRPAAARAPTPTAMIRPSKAATSGTHPAKRTGSTSEPVGLGDDLLHDLVGPCAYPRQPGIAPCPLDWKLAHVAVAAEDLDRVVCHLARDLGRQQLGLRDLSYGILALVPLPRSLVDEGLDRGDLRPHVDELVLDHLKVRDRLAERLALQGVVLRVLEHPVRPGDRTGGGDHSLALQLPHEVLESLAFLADQVADRDVAVLEQQLGSVGGVHAELLQRARDLEALGPFLDEQQVVAGVSTVAFDLGHDERPLAASTVRDEDLSTIDDELVAVSLRGGR